MNDDLAAAAQRVKERWKMLWAALRREREYTPRTPTRDDQIVANVLAIIGDATVVEDGVKRPIDRGDVEGTLYHLRQAVAAMRRIRAQRSKPALLAMERRAGELRKAIEVGLPARLPRADRVTERVSKSWCRKIGIL